jgi:hypothetical protein
MPGSQSGRDGMALICRRNAQRFVRAIKIFDQTFAKLAQCGLLRS